MIILWQALGFIAGFGTAWFIYTKKLDAIKEEVSKVESSAIGEVRSLVGRIKAHL